jgi:molecular chaperone GrpE
MMNDKPRVEPTFDPSPRPDAAQGPQSRQEPTFEPPLADEAQPAPPANDTQPAADAAALAEEVNQLKDKLLRAMAETENLRRRFEREREDTAKYAVSNFAKELVTVADNLRRAIDSIDAEARTGNDAVKSLAEGVEVTERAMLSAFERFGVKRIDPTGQRFDPNLHQAMAQIDSDQPAGTVVQVMQPGYVIHGRLLRAAMVIVAKARPAQGSGGEASTAQSGVDIKA